ncbi:hypothetical protein, partial [Cellulomonas iranensis]
AERRAAAERASAQQRAAEQQAAADRAAAERAAVQRAAQQQASAQPRTTSGGGAPRRTYRVGEVVNGHVLTPDNRWVPVSGPAASTPQRPRPQQQAPGGTYRRVLPFLVVGFVLLQVVRACGA